MARGIMNLSRRSALAGAAVLLASSRASAQSDAGAPITLIVPFAAGGPTDIVARLAAEGMARRLGRSIVIENVAGAGGATGTLRAARARPDGATMVLGQMATHALTPILNAQAGYDPVADFEPIGLIASAPMVLAARKGAPAATLREFRDFVAANGKTLSFGHAGLGATSNVACELFNAEAMAMPASVAYRGTAPALNDLVGGQIDYVCDQVTSIAPLIRAGQVQGVALMSSTRSAALPELASSAEQGFPGLSVEVWNGLLFPKGTPRAAVMAANAALRATLADPALAGRLAELGASAPAGENMPEAFGTLIRVENERWRPILQRIR
jgi:tripartite-type tricarboxylate transporter receptor subunit TctC